MGAALLATCTVVLTLPGCSPASREARSGQSGAADTTPTPDTRSDTHSAIDEHQQGTVPGALPSADELRARLEELNAQLASDADAPDLHFQRGRVYAMLRRRNSGARRFELMSQAMDDFAMAHSLAGGDPLVDLPGSPLSPQQAADIPTDDAGHLVGYDGVRRDANGQLIKTDGRGEDIRVGGPGHARALVEAGRLMLGSYRMQEAFEYFRRAEVADADDPHVRAEKARMRGFAFGEWDAAINTLRDLADRASGEDEVTMWFLLATCYDHADRLDEAERAYRHVLSLSPGHGGAQANLGLLLVNEGDADSGTESLQAAAQADPGDVYGGINLSAALTDQDRCAEALEVIEDVLKVAPNIPAAWLNYANALGGLGRYEESIRAYRHTLALLPGYLDAYYNMGTIYTDWGRYDKAIHAFHQALEIDPQSAKTLYNLGNACAFAERFTDAADAYRRALTLRPEDPRCWNNLGNVLASLDRDDEARQAYRKALQINPRHINALMGLAACELASGQLQRALATCDKALAFDHDQTQQAHFYRGVTRMQLNRMEDAIDDLSQAIATDPDDATADYARIFACLIHDRLGNDRLAPRILDRRRLQTDSNEWPAPVVRYYAGILSLDDLLAAAGDDRMRCEAYYYIGERQLLQEGDDQAERWFLKCVDTERQDLIEHRLATWRLQLE